MKSQSIKLTKREAITIAHRALVERVMERPGIWTYLNARIRRMQLETIATAAGKRVCEGRQAV
jgi:hypothetical protein